MKNDHTYEYRKFEDKLKLVIRRLEIGECTKKILSKLKITEGLFYHTIDTNEIYYDFNGKRYKLESGSSGGEIFDLSEYAKLQYVKNEINKKQDKLVSGKNIKTINNKSLLGSGDIEIKTDSQLSQELINKINLIPDNFDPTKYVNKTDLTSYAQKTDLPDLTSYAKKTDLPDLSTYVKESVLETYAKKTDLPDLSTYVKESVLETYAKKTDLPDLTSYAKKTDLPDLTSYAKKTDLPDLTSYAQKTDLPDLTTYVKESVLETYVKKTDLPDLTTYAKKTDLPDLSTYVKNTSLDEYVKTTDINGKFDDLATLKNNFNEIDDRIASIEEKLGVDSDEIKTNNYITIYTNNDYIGYMRAYKINFGDETTIEKELIVSAEDDGSYIDGGKTFTIDVPIGYEVQVKSKDLEGLYTVEVKMNVREFDNWGEAYVRYERDANGGYMDKLIDPYKIIITKK